MVGRNEGGGGRGGEDQTPIDYRRDDFSRRVNGELFQIWEDPIREVLRLEWRTKLSECASKSEWKQVSTKAEIELGHKWCLPWLKKNDRKDDYPRRGPN